MDLKCGLRSPSVTVPGVRLWCKWNYQYKTKIHYIPRECYHKLLHHKNHGRNACACNVQVRAYSPFFFSSCSWVPSSTTTESFIYLGVLISSCEGYLLWHIQNKISMTSEIPKSMGRENHGFISPQMAKSFKQIYQRYISSVIEEVKITNDLNHALPWDQGLLKARRRARDRYLTVK